MKLKRILAATVACCSLSLLPPHLFAEELVLPSEVAASHWKTRYMKEFAEAVDKGTGGELDVKIFPAGQLYNDQDALAALGTGAVHMVWPVSVRVESIDPRVGVINLPFALDAERMANQCYADGLTELLSSYVEPRQLKILGLLRTADLFFIFSDRNVQKLEDLKGSKIRVTGGRVFLDTIRSVDASPVSMAASEMSTALAQGAIDGVFTSAAGWAEMIGATGKYAYYVPNLSMSTYAVVVDRGWFEGLPEDQQTAIEVAFAEIIPRQWQEVAIEDQELIDKMVKGGAQFHTASTEDIERWKALSAGNIERFSERYPEVQPKVDAIAQSCTNGD
ncbi:TRAP transporter substrate-binding protein DctP [Stutzerimonas stutzeri]|uniref:TRAP transporter substrate-binding protein DctP n=1 Tax=Stutzerimonas stutzeri TaxID=316 RepID=UPI002108E32E|nr:TRAP transporter substrate-binding protein DctP [Stutzerimonas stutzeri]MCQ4321741.1 TRAP transporter substrate-binding protein DctP [Stutzerimonas stutzeri]